jgi:HD-GYP domain-containing protein (c-di-GMP phosphodiesterase class II)
METGPHVNRVASYSVELYKRWAAKKGIIKSEIDKKKDVLRLSAMLHDVGKVAISDLVLKKPGKLTCDEFEIMKKHTIFGAGLFRTKNSDFDEMSAIVALNHHENWDGTGYPGYLDIESGIPVKINKIGKPYPKKKDEIPIFGRIVALADVYDALLSKRVYKNAWSKADTVNEIIRMRGKKFDPELVDIFIDNIKVFDGINIKYPE